MNRKEVDGKMMNSWIREHIDEIEIANNLALKRSIAVSVRRKEGGRLQVLSVYSPEGFAVTREDYL